MKTELLINKVNKPNIWDKKPVYCFTSDVDWASESVLEEYFKIVNELDIKPTLFVTHSSKIIEDNFNAGNIERGIHPNFLNGSSHGNNFKEVIETCIPFAPESIGSRSHRAFEVTDTSHMIKNEFNLKYISHQISVLQTHIRPILVESGLINFPVFFEDGTHLYNQLNLSIKKYKSLFSSPGIKIISFHPMNFVFNSPTLKFMRNIKDSLTRHEYNNITTSTIKKLSNKKQGIKNTVLEIIEFVKNNDYPIFTMNELYNLIINN